MSQDLINFDEKDLSQKKINEILVFNETQKQELISGLNYLPIPYMPITEEFAAKYILNDVEYPVIEGKLSQAAIEMRSRFNNLIDSNYEYQRTQLEIEEIELEIEEIQKSDYPSETRRSLDIRKIDFDLQIKVYRLFSIKQSLDSTYKDFMCWKNIVEGCIETLKEKDPNIQSINDIQFDKIRIAEMSVKVKRWLDMAEHGEDLTQPQKVLVYDHYLKQKTQAPNQGA